MMVSTFTKRERSQVLVSHPKSGMNVAMGDIFNQGKYAVYVSNISEDGVLIQGNNLWVPRKAVRMGRFATKTWRATLALSWAVGALVPNSGISIMMEHWIYI